MSNQTTKGKITVSPKAIDYLKQYDWPGNVRELQNVIERMMIYCDGGHLGPERLPAEILSLSMMKSSNLEMIKTQPDFLNYTRKSKRAKSNDEERHKLLLLLAQLGGNISSVAKDLGVNRCTIYRKMKRYNIIQDDA